ncbi:hypothetical protein LTR36_004075 [Oleoguttula mirabilis]|uniref:Uncharacterized protein n=1 Tax=Oleoguttula mirabilis TaxID=1507867 RepID=A0AAV9JH35_9PEZI|nr:hypothetical protein LTR36_004075 [Oleoguttula mirabilis]
MLFHIVLLATAAFAAPFQKRALSSNDQSVLDLALYLEHLEFALYYGGCNNFTDSAYTTAGFPNGFRENICVIGMLLVLSHWLVRFQLNGWALLAAQHEAAHIAAISSILAANGATVNPPCTYNFQNTSPKDFVELASFITNVGIGAYLGGSGLLTDNAILEEVAASILTVEARHDTYLRTGIAASPFPSAFDTGLTATWAFNLAQMFVVSCPTQLPIVKLPTLNLLVASNQQLPGPTTTVGAFGWDPSQFFVAVDSAAPLYIAIVNQNISAPIFVPLNMTSSTTGTATLPQNITGAAFACLTTFAGGLDLAALSSYGTLAGPVELLLL